MTDGLNLNGYATKMRQLVLLGMDMEVDARFVDMLSGRSAVILDIGCGIGNAVNAFRTSGHTAYGIDPTEDVLEVAKELYDPAWFRQMMATDLTPSKMTENGLPHFYDMIHMSGNVPFFLSAQELRTTFKQVAAMLNPGGSFIVGTSTAVRGGPTDQDELVRETDLRLLHRFADWHLAPFEESSAWSVSVYRKPGQRPIADSPDGIFILG